MNIFIRRSVIFTGAVALSLTMMTGVASAAPTNGAKAESQAGGKAEHSSDKSSTNSTNDDDSQVDSNATTRDSDNKHPSGRDRHEDKGTQGRSASNPDGDGKGMDRDNTCGDSTTTDKPYTAAPDDGVDGTGGCDQSDQDGNNGCGNDDDFEDDNNGWCGKPSKAGSATTEKGGKTNNNTNRPEAKVEAAPVTTVEVEGTSVTAEVATEVLGSTIERPAEAAAVSAAPAAEVASATARKAEVAAPQVAAAQAQRQTEVLGVSLTRANLARTGITVGFMALIGLGLVVAGGGLRRFGHRRTA